MMDGALSLVMRCSQSSWSRLELTLLLLSSIVVFYPQNKDAEMLNANNTNASDSDKVYIVSCQWMINLMKYIHESNESSTDADADAAPGKMMIAPLLQTDDTAATAAGATCANSSPSSSTTDDRTARRERWSRIKETKDGNISSASLKKGLKFGQDYTLVGEGLWTLLSSKFGYDDSLQFEIGWKKGDKDMSMYMAGTETGLIGGSTDDNNNDTSSGDKKVVKVVDEVVLLPQDGKIDYSRIINANSSGDDNDGLVSEDGSVSNWTVLNCNEIAMNDLIFEFMADSTRLDSLTILFHPRTGN